MKLWTLLQTRLEHVRNARSSRPLIQQNQLRKFRRLARHVHQRSPYYRDLMDERGIDPERCVPTDFPVLTKSVLMENFDRICTVPTITKSSVTEFLSRSTNAEQRLPGGYTVVHTSGTSGEVGLFVYSPEDWARGVAQALRINPFRAGRRRLAFFGATGGHFTGVSFAITSRWSLLRHLYEVVTLDINGPVAPAIEELNRFQPEILMGYPSAVAILADRQHRGDLRINPSYIQVSGEPLVASDRARVEEVFGVPVINTYSCTEHLIMGYGRGDWGGIYLLEDDLHFELNSDHTLVTNLFNRTLPLIRYRMNDVLQTVEDPNPVYPFIKVREIAGRSEQTPFFTNEVGQEDFLNPSIIIEFLVEGVRRFQLVVVSRTRCFLRVCLDPGLTAGRRETVLEAARSRLAEIFRAKRMSNVQTDVISVEELPADARTGKFRLILFESSVPSGDSTGGMVGGK